MDVARAFEIVLELAEQNVIDQQDNPSEYNEQMEALRIITDIATNEYGDD